MINCHLTTPRVRRWLAHTKEARILHLFADVCNLVNEEGQVVSLVSERIGAGPFALVLRERQAWPGTRDDQVRIDHRAGRLYAGPMVIDHRHARFWEALPEWHRLGQWVPDPITGVELGPGMTRLLVQLLDAICRDRQALIRQAAARLAGRGLGLTPTGDDLLVGVLYALWVWRPTSAWISVIAESAMPHTTTLSAAFLEAAAAGEAALIPAPFETGRRDEPTRR